MKNVLTILKGLRNIYLNAELCSHGFLLKNNGQSIFLFASCSVWQYHPMKMNTIINVLIGNNSMYLIVQHFLFLDSTDSIYFTNGIAILPAELIFIKALLLSGYHLYSGRFIMVWIAAPSKQISLKALTWN